MALPIPATPDRSTDPHGWFDAVSLKLRAQATRGLITLGEMEDELLFAAVDRDRAVRELGETCAA